MASLYAISAQLAALYYASKLILKDHFVHRFCRTVTEEAADRAEAGMGVYLEAMTFYHFHVEPSRLGAAAAWVGRGARTSS